jgi:alpha-amylase
MSSRLSLTAVAVVVVVVAACAGVTPPSSVPSTGATATAEGSPSPSTAACTAPASDPPVRGWWDGRVFYEVFVRSFADSDGDGIGDLRGLTGHLDDLNDGDAATTGDLGVTGLWLMPIAESPSYHGYDVVDYRAVERDYGTAEDLRALVAAAHERGIAVILDLVVNHTSRDHPWFQDARRPGSEHDDWYVWSEEHPGVARPDGSRVWHPDGDRFYYGYFWEGMPDLNLQNADVSAQLDEVATFWLDDMGVDGFRLDAARHLVEDGETLENTSATFAWLEGFRRRIHDHKPEALVLGEVWDASSMSSKYVREGALDLSFDFGLASATITSLRSGDAGSLLAAYDEVASLYPRGGLATFLTNHDQDRIVSQLNGDLATARLAGTLLLTGPGTPFVYYGEEIGLSGRKPDERIRPPMRWDASGPGAGFTTGTPWEAFGDDPPGTDVATQSADPESLLSTYRDVIALRAANPALAAGELLPVVADEPSVAAFLRPAPSAGQESILVLANLADSPVPSITLRLDEGPLCGTTTMDLLYGSADFELPTVTGRGGFEGYSPVSELDAREVVVFGLRT